MVSPPIETITNINKKTEELLCVKLRVDTSKKKNIEKVKYHFEEDVCRVDPDHLDKKNLQFKRLRDLRIIQIFKSGWGKDVEDSINSPRARKVLICRVCRSGFAVNLVSTGGGELFFFFLHHSATGTIRE